MSKNQFEKPAELIRLVKPTTTETCAASDEADDGHNFHERVIAIKHDVNQAGKDIVKIQDSLKEIRGEIKELDKKIDTKFEKLDTKIDSKVEQLDNKIGENFNWTIRGLVGILSVLVGLFYAGFQAYIHISDKLDNLKPATTITSSEK